ncbi:MAG TPA: hypothetical protein VFV50_17105 [Bdellovibrionales bacterium]|nr:hypothetical protein [Bdellovibrionales bacterium]
MKKQLLSILFLFLTATGCVFSNAHQPSSATAAERAGRKLSAHILQLTGTHLKPGQIQHTIQEIPDPAPPYLREDGSVELYGSAPYYIRYKDWATYKSGGRFEIVGLELQNYSGKPITGTYTHPWDLRKYRLTGGGRVRGEVIVGGAMSPRGAHVTPVWPDDNPNRRIFRFLPVGPHSWRREARPIVGTVSMSWLGHSYGGNFFQPESGDLNTVDLAKPVYFVYERVNDDRGNTPFKTEIYIQTLANVMQSTDDPGVRVIGVGERPWPATRRSIGGYLVEGPRPAVIEAGGRKFYVIGFSSGDFCTDGYSINYAWSRDIMGPYQVARTADGRDLLDLGRELKAAYGLSWMGRPAFYRTPDGDYEVLFHAVDKRILPDNDYSKWPKGDPYQLWQFFRSVFKAKLAVTLSKAGEPELRIVH